jgi:hypothetical protein
LAAHHAGLGAIPIGRLWLLFHLNLDELTRTVLTETRPTTAPVVLKTSGRIFKSLY